MKKSGLLNAELARIVAAMGHTDRLVVADAGLPVPPGVPRVDLAVAAGIPRFLDVARAIAGELQVETVTVADELLSSNPDLVDALRILFPSAALDHAPHEEFKRRCAAARAVVRTGEVTPYANAILGAGVVF